MNGRDNTTTLLPLDFRIGGQNRNSYSMIGQYLTRDQTRCHTVLSKNTAPQVHWGTTRHLAGPELAMDQKHIPC